MMVLSGSAAPSRPRRIVSGHHRGLWSLWLILMRHMLLLLLLIHHEHHLLLGCAVFIYRLVEVLNRCCAAI